MELVEKLILIVVYLIVAFCILAFTSWLLFLAWNYLVPISHLPKLNFWQALALMAILSLIGSALRRKS